MDGVVRYGQTSTERLVDESRIARDIVREIGNFGITERQRWLIINALALELENVEDLKALTGFIREHKGAQLFLSGNEEVDSGTPSK